MGLLGGSDSTKYLARARNAQLRGVDAARVERDITADKMDAEFSAFASAAEDLFSPYASSLEEGADILDRFSDPARFQEALDAFYANPQYKLIMDESNKALERKYAAMGDRYSGSQIAGAIEHSQQQANKMFGDYANTQLGIAAQKLGIGQYGVSGVQSAREAGLQGRLSVIEAKDRSQDELEKARIKAEYQIAKGQAKMQEKKGIAGLVGTGLGAYVGFAMGGPLGALFGSNIGGSAASGAMG